MGWLMVCFDLPVLTKAERKRATQFRKFLLDDGYDMIQFSVYARPCVTFARQQTHLRRLELNVPPEGSVRAIFVTRAQLGACVFNHWTTCERGCARKVAGANAILVANAIAVNNMWYSYGMLVIELYGKADRLDNRVASLFC